MKTGLKFKNAVEKKIESFAMLDGRVRKNTITLCEDETVLTAVLDFDGFGVKLVYSVFSPYRGYNFLEDNKAAGECLNTYFIFPFSELEYSIYDVHNAVDDKEFVPLEFHTIHERQFADEAVDTVLAFISRHIDELNHCTQDIKAGLDKSFENGVSLASRRMRIDEIKASRDKLEKHRRNLYSYRFDQSYFINFICNGKSASMQRWLAKLSAKNKLLTFEERYMEYLMENDFRVENEKLRARLKKNEKNQLASLLLEAVMIVFGAACAGAVTWLCDALAAHIFYDGYEKLKSFSSSVNIPFVIMMTAFSVLLMPILKKLFFRKKNTGFTEELILGSFKIIGSIALAVLLLMSGTQVLLDSKCVAVGPNDFYYCESIGKQRHIDFRDVQVFTAEGFYEGDEFVEYREYFLVFDGDYNNYVTFDEEDGERLPLDKLVLSGEFKTVRDFELAYCDYE